jgi:integrase
VPKLSMRKVAALSAPGRYGDGNGLWLQVSSTGSKAWLLRYMLAGRARHMGLGPLSLVTLAEAREKALAARRQLLDGIDPLEARAAQRQHARLEAAAGIAFRQCAERYIAAHEAGWRNAVHRKQWHSSLATYCYPVLGDLPVAAIDTGMVLKALEPIWHDKTETASRVRGRIEVVLDWASARGYRTGSNPARWKGHLAQLLPARRKVRSVEHHAAMSYSELPSFMAELRQREGVSERALELVILTAARSGEALGARWDEIDLDAKMWVVPADRMKGGRQHRVPLSGRVVEILEALPREQSNPHVFIGSRAGKPIWNRALFELLRRMGRNTTTHGFRACFKTWASERTGFPREVAEAALAHLVGDAVERAYGRTDLFEKRRLLMDRWAEFCGSTAAQHSDVIPINAGRVS